MSMKYLPPFLISMLIMVVASFRADAQVPPHRPGTICFTAYTWCWLNPPKGTGEGCTCPKPGGGVVTGTAG
jgi:hypothetical protein